MDGFPIHVAAYATFLRVSMMVKLVEPQGRIFQLGRQGLSFQEQAVKDT